MLTVDDILAQLTWVKRGSTEEARRERLRQMEEKLFPEGLDPLEADRREQLLALAKTYEPRDNDPDPFPMPPEPAPLPPSTWEGLVSESSAAFRRGSIHDGTARELALMRERAVGSPFTADPQDDPKPPKKRVRVKEKADKEE